MSSWSRRKGEGRNFDSFSAEGSIGPAAVLLAFSIQFGSGLDSFTPAEIAQHFGMRTLDGARMAVTRAVKRLTQNLGKPGL